MTSIYVHRKLTDNMHDVYILESKRSLFLDDKDYEAFVQWVDDEKNPDDFMPRNVDDDDRFIVDPAWDNGVYDE